MSAVVGAADDSGTRLTVVYSQPTPHNSAYTVAMLGDAYYGAPTPTFMKYAATVLTGCGLANGGERYVVLLFTASSTRGADKRTLVHVLFDKQASSTPSNGVTFPGISAATWVYISDDANDVVKTQLTFAPVTNPILSQLGSLADKGLSGFGVLRTFKGLKKPETPPKTVYCSIAEPVSFPFSRATISESDFVQTLGPVDEGAFIGSGNDGTLQSLGDPSYKEIDGTAAFSNTPLTWITLSAGVGMLVGKTFGAEQAKTDNNTFSPNPLNKAATFAGATFHVPYDANQLQPNWREHLGFVLGAMITPAAGFVGGFSYSWRGFGVTAGLAEMWVQTLPAGTHYGDSSLNSSLVYRRTGRILVGGTYAFGGGGGGS
jgi:hypothetical protein